MKTSCIEVTGYRRPSGYGLLSSNGKRGLAHRQTWEAAHGAIPTGQVVRHRCDNPSCINLDHLELGTQADNVSDMVARGRSSRGADRHSAKLTAADVQHIRSALVDAPRGTAAQLARMFGVSNQAISQIANNISWSMNHA